MAPFDQVSAREVVSCPCGATLRFRSVVSALTERLLGDGSLLLNRMPPQKQFIGFGMSDAAVYGNLLEQTFSYTNTYYHKEPHLDITDPPAALLGKHDFIISSDVMEHVARPVDNAFRHLAELLKPGGVLVLTVPFATEGSTIEHFPELFEYKIVGEGADQQLINRTRDGREQCFDNLVFHGDDGATLEMRLFSRDDLIRLLQGAGFSDVRIHSRPIPSIGVIQIEPFSLPITAIKRR
ncbi:MAG: class I SAM-dependent methyltransferase [Proteobacteria bacterium]|nr:class I SAM-dependent methyltransferase [Pseudomonadota bacterium]